MQTKGRSSGWKAGQAVVASPLLPCGYQLSGAEVQDERHLTVVNVQETHRAHMGLTVTLRATLSLCPRQSSEMKVFPTSKIVKGK